MSSSAPKPWVRRAGGRCSVSAKKILVVDDDRVSRLSLTRMLQRDMAFEVIEAADGNEAWTVLEHDPDIDLVISDWVMPDCDGIQLTQRIRKHDRGRYVYVILLTSRSEHADLLAGMESGADEYLTKPFDPLELKLRVRAGLRILDLEDTMMAQNDELEAAYTELSEGINAAMRVQANLLPDLGFMADLRAKRRLNIDYVYKACQNLGGDLVGVVDLPGDMLAIFLGDVSGHGLAASMSAFSLHTYIRSHVQSVSDPLALVSDANVFCCEQFPEEVYATFVYMLHNTATGEAQLVVAGHPPVLHLRGGVLLSELESTVPPLGLFPDRADASAVQSISLKPGDQVFAYTDGVIETRNAHAEFFAKDNLLEVVCRAAAEQVDSCSGIVMDSLSAWRGLDVPPEDDVTLLSIRCLP